LGVLLLFVGELSIASPGSLVGQHHPEQPWADADALASSSPKNAGIPATSVPPRPEAPGLGRVLEYSLYESLNHMCSLVLSNSVSPYADPSAFVAYTPYKGQCEVG